MSYRSILVAVLALLPLCPIQAQTLPLAVRNPNVDLEKLTVEFDVLNTSTKPVHSWLMTVNIKAKNQAGETWLPAGIEFTSDACGRGAGELGPMQVRHCACPLPFAATEGTSAEADVQISALLYSDGTAEGDLAFLDSVIRGRRNRLVALQHWQERFREASKAPAPSLQLKSFAKMLFGADPDFPAEILYDSTAMREQKNLQAQLAPMLEAAADHPSAAYDFVSRLSQMFEQRIREAIEQCKAFPAPPKPYAQPAGSAGYPVENMTSGFRVVKGEVERDGAYRLVLKNYYEKEIVEYALSQRQSGEIMLTSRNLRDTAAGQAIAPQTLTEIRCGMLQDSDPPLEISCVIFRDGTSDGDQEITRVLNESWAGRLAEANRILPRLRALVEIPEAETIAAIESLIADLGTHDQEELDLDHSLYYAMGIRQQRQAFARELQEIAKQGPSTCKTRLSSLIRRFARVIAGD